MTKYDGEKIAPRQPHKVAEMLVDTTKGKDMKKSFTLIMCFSRAWCVQNFFTAFNHLSIDMKNCHLIIFDNSDNRTLQSALEKKMEVYKDAFYTARLYKTWRQGGKELVTMENAEWSVGKLPFIYEMHKDFLRMCTTKTFVLLEDDTLPPYKTHPDVVMRMLSILKDHPKAAVVTALATGRSSTAYAKTRLGVHYLKREGNKVIWRLSPNPKMRGLKQVDATGWFCCAALKDPWLRAFDGMDQYVHDVPRFALDVVHTNNIKKLGYDLLADFDMCCIHMNHTPNEILFWGRKQARPMLDLWLPEWKVYAQGVLLTAPECKPLLRKIMKDIASSSR
ncbi:hypothetical protein ES708_20625 [subsurface metagenome]